LFFSDSHESLSQQSSSNHEIDNSNLLEEIERLRKRRKRSVMKVCHEELQRVE
jgi:hypothetical protein